MSLVAPITTVYAAGVPAAIAHFTTGPAVALARETPVQGAVREEGPKDETSGHERHHETDHEEKRLILRERLVEDGEKFHESRSPVDAPVGALSEYYRNEARA